MNRLRYSRLYRHRHMGAHTHSRISSWMQLHFRMMAQFGQPAGLLLTCLIEFQFCPFVTHIFRLIEFIMADDSECTAVKLKSKQEEVFEVEKEVACRSITVKNMVEDTGLDAPVPLPMVDSKILIKVIEYCKYHHRAEAEALPEDDKSVWDKDFVRVDDETLFNLILAANYLDIKSLLDLTCKTVADEIKGKTPEEIRTRFNIKNDFTPEEEEEVKRETAWCEER